MANSIARDEPSVKIIVGVDTHKHEHVAVAINDLGARLGTCRASANRAGYADLVIWARTLGAVEAFGIEGTGSYGVGLARFVRRQGLRGVEVNHGDRRKRRNNGKNDTLDAESAARSVLAGVATAIPKVADGTAEMVRPDQDRPRYGHQGAQCRDHDAQDAHRERAGRTPRSTRAAHRPKAHRALRGPTTRRHHRPDRIREACATGARGTLAHVVGRGRRPRRGARHPDQDGDADPARGVRDWRRLGSRNDDRCRRQPHPDPIRSRVREAVRRVPDSRLERGHEPASALPRRPPPSQRGALPDRDRPACAGTSRPSTTSADAPPRACRRETSSAV